MLNAFIDTYFEKSVEKVKSILVTALQNTSDYSRAAEIWKEWIDNFSRFSLGGFLQSTKSEVVSKLISQSYRSDIASTDLENYIPWSDEGLTAWSVYNYTEQLDQSMVQYLRDELANWWSDNMHHIDGGMSGLPKKMAAAFKVLGGKIKLQRKVDGIQFSAVAGEAARVQVTGDNFENASSPTRFSIGGTAVIVTTPLHIIRQIKITTNPSSPNTPDFPSKYYQAIEEVWYGPSTKIMIQTKERFWHPTIKGGFSKTNLPIGQLHYPTAPKTGQPPTKGILLVYTWKSEALLFGALSKDGAIKEAIRQIKEIHSDIDDYVDKDTDGKSIGFVEAWYDEPTAQGAYVLLKPRQYRNIEQLMYYPFCNLFFAGEGISFASGWIQGALESGLRAAYQFYARNEKDQLHKLRIVP
jgi:monoamine oxidase